VPGVFGVDTTTGQLYLQCPCCPDTTLRLGIKRPAVTIIHHVKTCTGIKTPEQRDTLLATLRCRLPTAAPSQPVTALKDCLASLQVCRTPNCKGILSAAKLCSTCQLPPLKAPTPSLAVNAAAKQTAYRQQKCLTPEQYSMNEGRTHREGLTPHRRQQQPQQQSQPTATATDGITWDLTTPRIAEALDCIPEGLLVETRQYTSAEPLRSKRQQKLYSLVLAHVTELLAAALDTQRSANRDVANGHGAANQATATTLSRRAVKLWHLVTPLAFGRQQPGRGVQPAERVHALFTGEIHWLLQHLLSQQLPSPRPPGLPQPRHTEPDEEWTEADRWLQHSCAALSKKKRGISQAARKLEGRESHAPPDAATEAALRSKHPAAGTRPTVTDTAAGEVKTAVTAARARLNPRANSAPTDDMDVTGDGPQPHPASTTPLLLVTASDVLAALNRACAGKAAGLDGLRYEHI
jgi:hypothetical protein